MKISFFAYYREPDYAGCREAEFPAPKDLRGLGEELGARYGEKFRAEFFSPDASALGEQIIVLVNGRRAEFLKGLDTPLKDSDRVLIFPIVAGG